MFDVVDSASRRLGRRDFLRVGTLGVGGFSLPWLLRLRKAAASAGEDDFVRDASVIVVYCGGGASHIETFNPNMEAPAPQRSVVGEVKTKLPGVTFGSVLPRLAAIADKLAVVRSFHHSVGSHPQAMSHMLTGGTDPSGAADEGHSMGSFYSRLRGTADSETGMPTYSVLTTKEIDGPGMRQQARFLVGSRPGTLGPAYGPFNPMGEGQLQENMQLHLEEDRVHRRMSLLDEIDRLRREVDAAGNMEATDDFRRQALDVIFGGVREAFDISREDPQVVARYDTGGYEVGYEKFRPCTLGKRLLIARRMCEAGCGFVTVHFDGWDNHGGNRPGIVGGMKIHGPPLDKAVSALIEDLEARGQLDRTLVVVTGDFGRTPKINSKGGRDHWPRLSTLALAGGGLPGGVVIGSSDRQNGAPASDPVSLSNLTGTILHTLLDVGKLRVARGVPSPLLRWVDSLKPIAGLAVG